MKNEKSLKSDELLTLNGGVVPGLIRTTFRPDWTKQDLIDWSWKDEGPGGPKGPLV